MYFGCSNQVPKSLNVSSIALHHSSAHHIPFLSIYPRWSPPPCHSHGSSSTPNPSSIGSSSLSLSPSGLSSNASHGVKNGPMQMDHTCIIETQKWTHELERPWQCPPALEALPYLVSETHLQVMVWLKVWLKTPGCHQLWDMLSISNIRSICSYVNGAGTHRYSGSIQVVLQLRNFTQGVGCEIVIPFVIVIDFCRYGKMLNSKWG